MDRQGALRTCYCARFWNVLLDSLVRSRLVEILIGFPECDAHALEEAENSPPALGADAGGE